MSQKRICEDVVRFQLELVSLGLRTFGAVFGCVEGWLEYFGDFSGLLCDLTQIRGCLEGPFDFQMP